MQQAGRAAAELIQVQGPDSIISKLGSWAFLPVGIDAEVLQKAKTTVQNHDFVPCRESVTDTMHKLQSLSKSQKGQATTFYHD